MKKRAYGPTFWFLLWPLSHMDEEAKSPLETWPVSWLLLFLSYAYLVFYPLIPTLSRTYTTLITANSLFLMPVCYSHRGCISEKTPQLRYPIKTEKWTSVWIMCSSLRNPFIRRWNKIHTEILYMPFYPILVCYQEAAVGCLWTNLLTLRLRSIIHHCSGLLMHFRVIVHFIPICFIERQFGRLIFTFDWLNPGSVRHDSLSPHTWLGCRWN